MAYEPQNEASFWKRIGYVAIEDRNHNMVAYGNGDNETLDFKFDGTFACDICPEFTVGILGLSLETINKLTVWNPCEAITRARRIQVFAGYEKDGIANPILEGVIYSAIPTNPPDMWLNIKCLKIINKKNPVDGTVLENKTLEEIWGELAKLIGLEAKWFAIATNGKKVIKRYYLRGNPPAQIESFCLRYGVNPLTLSDTLIALDDREWTRDPKEDKLSKQAKNSREDVYLISKETGMIGLSNVSVTGATVRMRLTNIPITRSWVKLESKVIPSANGYYFSFTKRLVGHLRGNDWYTELDLIRQRK